MGLFDFLAKRREEKERARAEAAQREKERRASQRELREQRARTREARRRQRDAERKVRREQRRRVAYERIFFWVESRIGIIADMDDAEVRDRLTQLLGEERKKGTAPRLHGNMNYDPYAGLEAYIRTNSYRRMLEDRAWSQAGMLEQMGTQTEKGGEDEKGGAQEGTIQREKERTPPSGPRYQELASMHPSYGRLQYWIEQRIGNIEDLDQQTLHEKLLQLISDERKRNPPRIGKNGKMFDPTAGLEAYIRSKAYLRFIGKLKI